MKIAIIETGLPPEEIRSDFASYPEMIKELIQTASTEPTFDTYSFCHSEFKQTDIPDLNAYHAFIIMGSPAGVYEDWPWMQPLFAFIRDAANANKPMVGICFGHQAIAQALGGNVTKSPKGWGIGRHTYKITTTPAWMTQPKNQLSLAVSHQDQVITQPPNSKILAHSEFTNFAALYYPETPALTFQGHPEFADDYSEALYSLRAKTSLINEDVQAAIESLNQPEDNELVAKWMWEFFQHHTQA